MGEGGSCGNAIIMWIKEAFIYTITANFIHFGPDFFW